MSKVFYFMLFIACIIFFVGCDRTEQKLENLAKSFNESQVNRLKEAKSRLFDLKDSLFKTDDFVLDTTKPMDPVLARLYIREFLRHAASREADPTLTRSIWIDKKVIADMMLTLLKQEELDGIRIYYAKYPKDVSEYDPDVTNPDRQTLIFVCTKAEGDKHVDKFYPKGTKSDGLYVYDYNSLCPNQCDGSTLGGN